MYYSFTVPAKYLKTFSDYQDFLFCDVDDFLNEPYRDFCYHSRKPTMLFGMNKKTRGITSEALINYGLAIGAQELVAPFTLFDGTKSYDTAYNLFKTMERTGTQNKFDIMLVPQGKTRRQFMKCAEAMSRLPAKTIGIYLKADHAEKPYALEQHRFNLIKSLVENKLLRGKSIHLFELYGMQFLKAYKKGSRYFKIRSLNTNFPVISAISGKSLDDTKRRYIFKVKDDVTLSDETVSRIKNNMEYLREYQ